MSLCIGGERRWPPKLDVSLLQDLARDAPEAAGDGDADWAWVQGGCRFVPQVLSCPEAVHGQSRALQAPSDGTAGG